MYRSASIKGFVDNPSKPVYSLARLGWLEPLWLGLLAAPLLLPGRLLSLAWHPFLLAALFLFWPLRWVRTRQSVAIYSMPRILGWCIGLLLLWLPINLLVSVAPAVSWEASGYLLFGLTLFIACINHPWLQKHPLRLAWCLLAVGGLLVIAAPPLVKWKSEFRLFYVPLYDWFQALSPNLGETIHANVLAGALVLLLPLTVALALPVRGKGRKVRVELAPGEDKVYLLRHIHRRKDLWIRLACLVLALLMIGLLVLTQSRGGYMGTVIALSLVILLRWPRLLYASPVVLLGLGFTIYHFGVWEIFDKLGTDNTLGDSDFRFQVWHASLQAFHDFTLTGIGIGTFRPIIPLLYPNGSVNNEAATHAHNLFLQVGLDLGLPGLLAYLGLWITMLVMAIQVLRRTGSRAEITRPLLDPAAGEDETSPRTWLHWLAHRQRVYGQHWALAAGALSGLVGMLVHGLLDAVTWGTKLAFLPWLFFALITLLFTYNDQPSRDLAE